MVSTSEMAGRHQFASVIAIVAASFFAYSAIEYCGVGAMTTAQGESLNSLCVSAFQVNLDDPIEIDASNRALSFIQNTYRKDFYNSTISHHHFVRTAPRTIQDTLSEFVWNDSVLKEVRTKFVVGASHESTGATATSLNNHHSRGSSGVAVIQDVFDEIYIMRPEFDMLDQKKVHYDGNLKLPGICTIRALTYLSGKDATVS